MMIAAQARAMSRQKNCDCLVESQRKKIDDAIRDMVAHHGDALYFCADPLGLEQVIEILEKAGRKVTRLRDAFDGETSDLKIERGE